MHYKVEFHTRKPNILLNLLPEFQTTLSGMGEGGGVEKQLKRHKLQ